VLQHLCVLLFNYAKTLKEKGCTELSDTLNSGFTSLS